MASAQGSNPAGPELDDPIPLTGPMIDMPAFPVDALPPIFSRKVTELAEFTQTDPAMAATSALTTLAACVGGHAKIQVRRGWQESMVGPLHDAEAEMSVGGEIERMTLQDELDMAKKTVEQLNKSAVNAAAKAADPKATTRKRPTRQRLRRR